VVVGPEELAVANGIGKGIGETTQIGPGPEEAECCQGEVVPLGIAVLREIIEDAAVG